MKTRIFFTFIFLFFSSLLFSQVFEKQGAGVTFIVHGWNPDDSEPVWMGEMAQAVLARNGNVGHIANITVTGTQGSLTAECTNWTFDLSAQTHAEIVILINWTAVANHLETGITAQDVAAAIVPKIYEPQNGQPALAELPIHLIGHSRGGGMVFEIARLLGMEGIEVEQLTALDPHPLTDNDPQPVLGSAVIDTPVALYENVLFADNYYQNIEFPTGQYVGGAYNRLWESLPGGYHNETGYTYTIGTQTYNFSDHLNIILAYHGTVDLATPTTNGEATMTQSERDDWFNAYENAGENTGFKYSRQIMGDRKSTDVPVSGGDQIIDGYHNDNFLGGSGARESLDWTNAVWPNVVRAEVSRDGSILSQGAQSLTADEMLQINYIYRTYAQASTINFYVDIDRNPYNDNNAVNIETAELTANGSVFAEASAEWSVSGLSEATNYYLYAAVENTAGKRYLYLDYEFEVLPAGSAEITSHPQDQLNICLGNTVDFSVSGNNIENYQWQVSADAGANWTDLSNNESYSGTYTNTLSVTVSAGLDGNIYRCMVSNSQNNAISNTASLETDSENPTISCPADQSIDLESGQSVFTVSGTEFDPTETLDNCEIASIENDFNNTETLDQAELPIGTTTIVWTVTDNAGNTAECSFDITVNAYVGISDTENEISIYPNPTSGIINFEFAENNIQKITISDITGKVIIEKPVNTQIENIDFSNYSNGIYLIKLQAGKEVFTTKIIKK